MPLSGANGNGYAKHEVELLEKIIRVESEVTGLKSSIDGKFDLIMNRVEDYFSNTKGCLGRIDEHSEELKKHSIFLESMKFHWDDKLKDHDSAIKEQTKDIVTLKTDISSIKTQAKNKSAWIAVILTAVINGLLYSVRALFGGHK